MARKIKTGCLYHIKDEYFDVVNDESYNLIYFEFVSEPPVKKCLKNNCKYALLCGGGCIMQKYLSNKIINDIDCHKEMFEKLTKEYLKINYGKVISKK